MFNPLADLIWLVFPDLCAACGNALHSGEKCICTHCRFRLPRTTYHLEEVNPVIKHFWGKVPITAAAAYYAFTKGEKVQSLIHQLKYKGRQDIGRTVGELYGRELRAAPTFASVAAIVPVPLHSSRLKKRGYNQSDCFAEGLSATMQVPWYADGLKRTAATETQTRKHRFERYRNVDRLFVPGRPDVLCGKHVLLVDDVVTTGSTLVACAEALLGIDGVQVSIAAIAAA